MCWACRKVQSSNLAKVIVRGLILKWSCATPEYLAALPALQGTPSVTQKEENIKKRVSKFGEFFFIEMHENKTKKSVFY